MTSIPSPPPPNAFPDGESHVLCVSGYGVSGRPGLYFLSSRGYEQVDDYPTTGLAYDAARHELHRLGWAGNGPNAPASWIRYSLDAVRHCVRPEVQDPHSLLVEANGDVAMVSTFTNEVIWVDRGADVTRRWSIPGEPDSGHVNSIFRRGDQLVVSLLGGSSRYGAYTAMVDEGRGLVVDVETGRVLASGLRSPHNPYRLGNSWLVCESGPHRLSEFVPGSPVERRREIELAGWTRGLDVAEEVIFVGESAGRSFDGAPATSSVALVDRSTFSLRERWDVPCEQIYDVLVVPRSVRDMVLGHRDALADERRTGALRSWAKRPSVDVAAVEPNRGAVVIRLLEDCPKEVAPGSVMTVAVEVVNAGPDTLTHAGPRAVRVSYRWRELGQDSWDGVEESIRTDLREALAPGEAWRGLVLVRCPVAYGHYELLITAVQESVHWFHDVPTSTLVQSRVLVQPLAPERELISSEQARLLFGASAAPWVEDASR